MPFRILIIFESMFKFHIVIYIGVESITALHDMKPHANFPE